MNKHKAPACFKFNIDKLIACLALLAQENFTDLDKLKICKLMYYADKYHLLNYGKPITGDAYVHLDYGPIPSKTLDILEDIHNPYPITIDKAQSNYSKICKYIKTVTTPKHKYPVYVLVKQPGTDYLSETEIEAVKETIKMYGKYPPGKLIDLTHKDASWKRTEKNDDIEYERFFEDSKKMSGTAFEYFESLKEDCERSKMLGFAL